MRTSALSLAGLPLHDMPLQDMNVEVISGGLAALDDESVRFSQAAVRGHGVPTLTSNPCDVAIQGEGYFQVRLPSGETAYSRAGTFELDEQGRLVTLHGYCVQPPVTVPKDTVDFAISASGKVTARSACAPGPLTIGQLQLATFLNPQGLEAVGEDLFRAGALSGEPHVANPGDAELHMGSLLQNYVEAFPDDAFLDIAALIIAQRAGTARLKTAPSAETGPVPLRTRVRA